MNVAAMKHIISLGAGVQSSVLALMAKHGEIGPMPEAAIFADTHHEPRAVYEWLGWLEKQLPFPVYRVSHGDLWKSVTRVRTRADGEKSYIATGIPVYFLTETMDELALRKGIGRRHCTRDFKTGPITAKVKELVGLKRASKRTPILATTWIGISADEAHRAKHSRELWIEKRFPLLELDMDRQECFDWMEARGYPKPPRSACTFCPFHDDDSWLALAPDELVRAAEMERELQAAYAKASAVHGTPFLHAQRVPLLQVKFAATPPGRLPARQRNLAPECEGFCGT